MLHTAAQRVRVAVMVALLRPAPWGNLGDHYAETLDRRTKGIETRLAMAFSRVALVSCLSRVEA